MLLREAGGGQATPPDMVRGKCERVVPALDLGRVVTQHSSLRTLIYETIQILSPGCADLVLY